MSHLSGFSMWDLFRGEVESQMRSFTDHLLAVEGGTGVAEHLAATMRAAHSIKGAARIVNLDVGVQLAHLMEDCLVAAQENTLVLEAASVDVLLSAGDLLSRLSVVDEAAVGEWVETNTAVISALLEDLAAVRAGRAPRKAALEVGAPAAIESAIDSPVVSLAVAPAVVAGAATTSVTKVDLQDRLLKVSSQTLNRLMGLAGETLVQSRWLEPFSESLLQLKRRQSEIGNLLEVLHEAITHKHATSLEVLSAVREKVETARQGLATRQAELEAFGLRSAGLADRLYREVVASRMRPFGDGVENFPRVVRDMARQLGKQAQLEIWGPNTEVDREILERLEAPLNHMIRNSLDHGLETPTERLAAGKNPGGLIRLEARHRAGLFALTVADDGRGVDIERLRVRVVDKGLTTTDMAQAFSEAELLEFLFLPGFSTAASVTDLSGRGVGLDAVQDMAKSVGGSARITSRPGQGMAIHLELPLTLSVVRTFVTEIGGEPFAFPITRVARALRVAASELITLEGQQYFILDGERIGVVPAHELLDLATRPDWGDEIPVVLLGDRTTRYGIAVDRFLGEYDMVVRPLDSRLGKVQDVSATALMEDGTPVLIMDVEDLTRSVETELQGGRLRGLGSGSGTTKRRKRILVVEDSITVRELERSLLQGRGYAVDVAVDGMDGWNALRAGQYDLLVSDIDMPRMTGIELVTKLKTDARLHSMPVIIVSYKDREEDRLAGLEAGADRFMTKSSFHDESLLEAVAELIGPAD